MHTDTHKTVEWSYPSSTHAERFGFSRSGCWTVETIAGHAAPVALVGFSEREAAVQFARRIPTPWSLSFRRINPQDAANSLAT